MSAREPRLVRLGLAVAGGVVCESVLGLVLKAHIRSFSEEGPNTVDNGILTRSDMHALFDTGCLTIDHDRAGVSRVVVSSRLRKDFGNGKDYFSLGIIHALQQGLEVAKDNAMYELYNRFNG